MRSLKILIFLFPIFAVAEQKPFGFFRARRPITATHLLTNGTDTSAASYTTSAVSFSANKLALVAIVHRVTSGTPNAPTLSGAGRTWTSVVSYVDTNGGSIRRVTIFRSLASSAASGTLTADFAGQSQVNGTWSINEFGGIDTSGSNGAGAIVQNVTTTVTGTASGISVVLAALSSARNAIFGVLRGGFNANVTPGSGYAELGEMDQASGVSVQTQWKIGGSTTVDWSFPSINNTFMGLALEIKAE